MKRVAIREAKTNLARLVRRACLGEERSLLSLPRVTLFGVRQSEKEEEAVESSAS